MVKVKDKEINPSFEDFKSPGGGSVLEGMPFEKKENMLNMMNSQTVEADPLTDKQTQNNPKYKTVESQFENPKQRSQTIKDNNSLLGESIAFDKTFDHKNSIPQSTIPMPIGEDKPRRKNFAGRDTAVNQGADRLNSSSKDSYKKGSFDIDSSYGNKNEGSKRRVSAKRDSKPKISNRYQENDSNLPKLDQRSSKMDKSINKGDTKNDKNYMNQSSITPNPNSAAKKSNKMLRQKNSINGTNTPNNNSINNNSINNNSSNNNQYQYSTFKNTQQIKNT